MSRETKQIKSVLIVDDIQSDRMFLERILQNENFTVYTADEGATCLDMAKEKRPSLILLDINMSPMDGYTLCTHIKEDPQLSSIPVIFISSNSETFDKVRGFKCGGVDYITKPLQSEDVIARATVHIQIHHLQTQLQNSIEQLELALSEVKQLKGLLPICAGCKNIRDDKGYWNSIESYIMKHSEAEFSHALCPGCMKSLYSQLEIPSAKKTERTD